MEEQVNVSNGSQVMAVLRRKLGRYLRNGWTVVSEEAEEKISKLESTPIPPKPAIDFNKMPFVTTTDDSDTDTEAGE